MERLTVSPELISILKQKYLGPRVKTPTVIQMENAESGAAALAIILGYHKHFTSLEELRYQCGVSRDGCNVSNLMQCARNYGLDSEVYSLDIKDLKKLRIPCILQWKNKNFVVLEGFGPNDVYVNDPAKGPHKISYAEFTKNFSGNTLLLKKTDAFVKSGSPPRFLSLLLERIKIVTPYALLALFILQLCVIVLGLLPPSFSRVFLDNFLGQHMWSGKWLLLGLMFLALILQAWSGLSGLIALRLSRKFTYYFSTQFLNHVLKLPILYFNQRYGAEIITRMGLNQIISSLMTEHLASATINFFLIAIYGIVIFRYDPLIASVGIFAALLNLSMLLGISRARSNNYSRLKQEEATSIGVAVDTLQNMESVKMMGNPYFAFSRIVGLVTRNINNFQEIGKKDVWLNSAAQFVNNLANLGLLGLGSWRVMEGHLSIGMLLALQMLMSMFLAPINQLIQFGMQIQTLKIDLMRLNDVLKNPIDPQLLLSNRAAEPLKLKGEITLENITFGYSPLDPPLFENFNLHIKAGEHIALVGPTGSGKSTLAKILCGILPPWQGVVRYDGKPLESLSQQQLKNTLGWVDQDIFLFNRSIRDNLTLWDDRIPLEQLVEATKDACIYDEIMNKKEGFDTLLNEGGANLSEGQRQRLEIARAFLLKPNILILDEATSALDSITEHQIFHHVSERNVTCVLVAHRLSTVKKCNRIIVLDKGQIVQMGTHDELRRTPGIYQELIKVSQEIL